jgi:hypothetical protein
MGTLHLSTLALLFPRPGKSRVGWTVLLLDLELSGGIRFERVDFVEC